MNTQKIKIISWNINGYRAALKKGFMKTFRKINADIFALQETRIQQNQLSHLMEHIRNYKSTFAFSTVKKGYSGVAIYTKMTPKSITTGIGSHYFDKEGRVTCMHFDDFVLFSVYFPNGQMNHNRLAYKLDFYEAFFTYADKFRKQGCNVVIVGDFNTAHNDIDLKHPASNSKRSGFLAVEREWMNMISRRGYVDTFRFLYPNLAKYSWWSYRFGARKNNVGWRIDYCFVSQEILDKGWLEDSFIYDNIFGSDHCPIGITLRI